ncbi:L,D-transpeptidase family protein [Bacillus sp. EB600]|uniref:L,D-transpeptidase family protein n=1 Tax=Bacillus sp. EB600 TaxID=2806345 RepID=UPI002109747D|nr:L,D-transpeptidase family protein [Bacillus sp. EB600]MCQ6280272.1 L,D-transpeptidase/peptidoglycan binding protein [Bacillus sp. EB600]
MYMKSTVNAVVEEVKKERDDSPKRFSNRKFTIILILIIIGLLFAGISYFQATRFNKHITINDTNVGGLTADQAMKKLESSISKNEVYLGQERILDGKDTKMGFTNEDLPSVKKLLKRQWTFFPSPKTKTFSLMPSKRNQDRSQTIKQQVEEKLTLMNKSLKAPQDAEAHLEQGKIIVSKSISGEQYDVASLLKDFQKQEYNSEIRLNPQFIQPLKEDSSIVKNEEKMLQTLLLQTVDYTVQDKVYTLKASDLIKNASVSKEMKVTIDAGDIKNKIAEINGSQSTLNKNFTFKTHSGSVISVKGEGYGWALNVEKETARIQEAFEKGEKSIPASAVYGNGWSNEGIGYETTANNGIGDTYAEVSIAEQRIWIYKNGQLALTTNVVTGRHNTNEDTHPGVWYILYKKSPSILRGTSVGHGGAYAVPVNYWAPFTNDGQGFHDASWRTNWANTAYIAAGSGGCVNTPPSVMKTVYDNLSTYEPVVIY